MSFHNACVGLIVSFCTVTSLFAQSSVTADSFPDVTGPNVEVKTGDTTTSSFRILNSGNTELFRVTGAGNVSIGATDPLYKLTVAGSLGLLGSPAVIRPGENGDNYGLKFMGTKLAIGELNSWAYGYTGSALAFITATQDGTEILRAQSNTGKGRLQLTQAGENSVNFSITNNDVPSLVVTPTGRVGVGFSNPIEALEVNGNAYLSGYLLLRSNSRVRFPSSNGGNMAEIYGPSDEGTGTSPLSFVVGSGEAMRIMNNGNVGIGGAIPPQKLSVYGNPVLNGASREVAGIYDLSAYGAGVGGGVVFGGRFNAAGTIAQQFASIQGRKENATDGNFAGALTFYTRVNGGQPTERVRIDSAGNVGIGKIPAADAKLDVQGNLNVSGTVTGGIIGATYQDLAEWVPSATDMAPGTVVVLNRAASNEVMPSAKPYDTAVAGVVSAQPGVLLGVAGDEKEMIATTGRVRVRVDASRHPIAVGDLLVSSDKPGTAMKSLPVDIAGIAFHRPGTLIGKALEPLASGEGEILVLLSLQ